MKKVRARERERPAKTRAKPASTDTVSASSAPPAAPNEAPSAAERLLRLRPRTWDALNLLLIVIVALAVRLPFVTAGMLDADEGEFMASAVYMQETGQPLLSWPVHPYTVGVYRLAADWFGRYNMLPVRLGTFISAALIGVLIYLWLARSTSRWCALFTGVAWSTYSLYYNICIASREYPCALALMVGAYLFLLSQQASGTRARWMLVASGFATGGALFWKEQAAYITQAIPLWLLLEAVVERRWQHRLQQALWYAIGGGLAGICYFLPMLACGALSARIGGFAEYLRGFSGFGVAFPTRLMPPSTRFIDQFYGFRPAKLLLLVAYGTCLAAVWSFGRQILSGARDSAEASSSADAWPGSGLLALCYIVTSSAAVSMGNRYGTGYFLMWAPFVFVAAGLGLHFLARTSGLPSIFATVLLTVIGLIGLGAYLLTPWALGLAVLATVAAILSAWQQRQSWSVTIWLKWMFAALLVGMLLVEEPIALSYAKNAAELDARNAGSDAVLLMQQRATPGDRLFVWGAFPEFYGYTGLEPASRSVVCGYADGHWFELDGIPSRWLQQLVAELSDRPPRFIIAGSPEFSPTFRLLLKINAKECPELADFVAQRYHRLVSFRDIEIYEANVPATRSSQGSLPSDQMPGDNHGRVTK